MKKRNRSGVGSGMALRIVSAGLLAAAVTAPAFAAGVEGNWTRKNGDTVVASVKGGKLYCKITKGSKPGFEMCNGMAESGGKWTGKKMKHPKMPGFMTFNGTVTVSGNSLSIKGCAVGQSACDAETWTRQ